MIPSFATLAARIQTSTAWIKRALAGDPRARRVKHRLAAALTEAEAAELNLKTEWSISRHAQKMRDDIEAIYCNSPSVLATVTKIASIQKWIAPASN